MQPRTGSDAPRDPPVTIARPATVAEIAIGDGALDEVDDDLAYLGAVLIVTGWDPAVELLAVGEDAAIEAPAPAPAADDEPGCGADDDDTHDAPPVFAAIVTVRGIQERLAWLGWYRDAVTGRIDPSTREALQTFQAAAGVAVSGLPDGATRDALAARIGW